MIRTDHNVMAAAALLFLAACGAEADESPRDVSAVVDGSAGPAPAVPDAATIDSTDGADPATVATALRAIPAGVFRPLFPGKGNADSGIVAVSAFAIEEHAVTNAQFGAFVTANPRWRRSQIKRLFADARYLAHWHDDLDPGPDISDRPVTQVSWFAARAYARWLGRRLPTGAEWESVAAASETSIYGRDEDGFTRRILDWYARRTNDLLPAVRSTFRNVHGVWDMHGLVWEWVGDFNSSLVTGESRGDTGLERNLFCGSGSIGAADPSDYAAFMRYAFRSSLRASYAVKSLGFRCATDAPDERR